VGAKHELPRNVKIEKSMSKDYYETLGVGKDASQDEITQAYRKMAVKYHPDKNPDDPKCADQFKAVAEAFEILSDPEKRDRYNRFGSSDNRKYNVNVNPFDIFGDIFGDFFGDAVSRSRRGADIQVELPPLTLEEVYAGCKKRKLSILLKSHAISVKALVYFHGMIVICVEEMER